ncbi:hypothetical protein C8R45DRAFT_1219021 [Mycena sanguinolenta]|nr:hypothetical protein C8R45DRAFT_1219021 [Mycena sanguinolenta]
MSTSTTSTQHRAPYALKRRRTLMACLNCRKRKLRCITTEQPPKNPCARCTKKNLPCEYVPATEHDDQSSSHSSSPRTPNFSESEAAPRSPSVAPSSSSSIGPPSRNSSPYSSIGPATHLGRDNAPPLPYILPPPPGHRPRYSGVAYPELSLSQHSAPGAAMQSSTPDQYLYYMPTSHPHPTTNPYPPYTPQNAQGHQYMVASPMPRTDSNPQPRQYTYQTPFSASTSMPAPETENDWLDPEGEDWSEKCVFLNRGKNAVLSW